MFTNWHNIDILIISALLHLAALLFVGINAGYLRCTRGLGSVRIKSVTSLSERCCKIRSRFVCNVMVLIHVSLLISELITAVILTFLWHTLSYTFWVLVVFDYLLLFVCMVCTGCIGTRRSHAHVGCLHAFSAFEFVNMIIFWAMVSFIGVFIPYIIFVFWVLCICAIPYTVLLCGAEMNYKRFRFYQNSISKSEATEKIKRILEEMPNIELHIKWKQSVENGEINDFIRHSVVLTISVALDTSA